MAPHTVTSTDPTPQGIPIFDSSPNVNFTKAGIEHPEILGGFFGPGGLMTAGCSFSLNTSILALGTYDYECVIHPGMEGSFTVTAAQYPASTATVVMGYTGAEDVSHWMFIPDSITVPQNMVIVWVNLELFEPHSVTQHEIINEIEVHGRLFDSSPAYAAMGGDEAAMGILGWAGPPFVGGLMLPAPYPYNSYNYTFTEPGIYQYYCKIHVAEIGSTLRGMVGWVIVLPETATPQDVDALSSQLATLDDLPSQVAEAQLVIDELSAQIDSLTTITYAAIGVGVIGIVIGVGAALTRRKP